MPIICDGLVDQKRVIGSDPVGHKCGNPGTVEYKECGFWLCWECDFLWPTGRIEVKKVFRNGVAHFTAQSSDTSKIPSDAPGTN